MKLAKEMGPEKSMIVCLSGRGDKDVVQVKDRLEQERESKMGKTLTEHLQKLKDQQQGIFVPYIMAGDHEKGLAGLQETIQFLEELGVSAIEVGIPFSDPVADGPVIEEAGLRSLAHGTTTEGLVQTIQRLETSVPLVIMTYFNPLFQYGLENFFRDVEGTAVKGVIIRIFLMSMQIW